jgi:hypothetical protein
VGNKNHFFFKKNFFRSSYLADDSPDAMGVIKLSLTAAETHASKHGGAAIDPVYLPNHHIFYGERVEDAHDALPKWTSFPEGDLAASCETNPIKKVDPTLL